MKGQHNSLIVCNRAKIALTKVFVTVLICMIFLSLTLMMSLLATYNLLAYGVGPKGKATTNCCIVTENASHVTSLSLISTNSNSKTLQFIENARQPLNRALYMYQKHNYTGTLVLATKAYLDNFEFVDVPLQQHDKILKQNTELMMRGHLRDQIKHEVPFGEIKSLIIKININLDKAEKILSTS